MRYRSLAAWAAAFVIPMVLATAPRTAAASGPAIAAPFNDSYTLLDLGAVTGVPTSYGGVFILASQPNTLYIGGTANRADGALYAVPLQRNEGNRITGFAGPAARVANAPYNDGGIVPDAGGLISFCGWPVNTYVQVSLATGAVVNQVDLNAFGVAGSAAAVGFIPGGYPGAGGMRIASYSGGEFYDIAFSVGQGGVVTIQSATALPGSKMPGGPEGWTYVPLGSPHFPAPSMIVSEYGAGTVAVYAMDASGNPIVASRRLFIDGLTGAEGAAIDPVSGEFIFSTFGSVNHVVVVSGFAVPPAVTVTPSALAFSAEAVGTSSAPRTITLANGGPGTLQISSITASGDFAFTSNCPASLAEESTCEIAVTFAPIASGARAGTLAVLTSASGSPFTVALSGTGLAGMALPHVEIVPGTLEFAPQQVGSDSALQFATVRNDGDATLVFTAIAAQGDFILSQSFVSSRGPCNASLPPGGACDIGVAFRPGETGLRQGAVQLETNAPDAIATLRLAGTGITSEPPRALSVPERLVFPAQRFGTRSAGLALRIDNKGAGIAAISELGASGDFSVADTCTTIAAGGSCSPLVFFQPTALGPRGGTLTIRALSESQPYVVALTGTGEPNPLPALALSATRIGFGNTFFGGAPAAAITATNIGQVPVVFSAFSVSGDFSAASACGGTLAPGAACIVQVTFLPSALGARGGVLAIASDAQGSPHSVDLSGTGCLVPNLNSVRLGTALCGR